MIVMREPIEMLVQVLANGGSVTYEGNEYAMSEDGSKRLESQRLRCGFVTPPRPCRLKMHQGSGMATRSKL